MLTTAAACCLACCVQYNVTVVGTDDEGEQVAGENMLQLTTPPYVELTDTSPISPTSGNATADPQPGDAFDYVSAGCTQLPGWASGCWPGCWASGCLLLCAPACVAACAVTVCQAQYAECCVAVCGLARPLWCSATSRPRP